MSLRLQHAIKVHRGDRESVAHVTRNVFSGGWGVQQIQLRTEDRENGDLGAVAP